MAKVRFFVVSLHLDYKTIQHHTMKTENKFPKRIKGSARISTAGEVLFTPYRRMPAGERPRVVAATRCGTLSESRHCMMVRMSFPKDCHSSQMVNEFTKLLCNRDDV